jgi:outer membrane immunogenic protein
MRTLLITSAALGSLLAGAAIAADMPVKIPYRPLPPVEVFSWTGLYLGGHIGYGASSREWSLASLPGNPGFSLGSGSVSGGLGGVQLGLNQQIGQMVIGIEGDYSLADLSGQTCNVAVGGGSILCDSKVNRLGTGTVRLGAAIDHALLYMKGGAAYVHSTQELNVIAGNALSASTSGSKWGWTAGAGVEYAFTRNWSARLEYDFMQFSSVSNTFTFPTAPPNNTLTADFKERVHAVKFAFNYKFDWIPVSNRY